MSNNLLEELRLPPLPKIEVLELCKCAALLSIQLPHRVEY